MNPENASNALHMLADAAIDREEDLANYSSAALLSDSDENSDSDAPIFDMFYEQGGAASIMKMTNFDADQFMTLYEMIQEHVATNWNVGRGRRSLHKPKDVFLMFLTVMKHGGSWDFLARIFQISASSFERLVMKFADTIGDVLFDALVLKAEKCNVPTVQSSYWENGRRQEIFLREAPPLRIETRSICTTEWTSFSMYSSSSRRRVGYEIMHMMLDFHEHALRKRPNESNISDFGPGKDQHDGKWEVLTGKGYQGAMEFCRASHPTKKPRNGHLTIAQEEENRHIFSDRIIVENFFGRLCTLWGLMAIKYRWSHENNDLFASAAVALTNFHIASKQLRDGDGDAYRRSKNRQYTRGTDASRRRAAMQKRYRQRRSYRLSMPLRARFREQLDGDSSF